MARKANGKRSVSRDGSVRVHGNASNGEGSVYLDADGSWRATYVAPGKRIADCDRRRRSGRDPDRPT
jgi:hypothetical protein